MHERTHLMPTDELEHELRRAFARRAAGYQHADQARQRLLQRNYRPRSYTGPAVGIAVAAAAGAAVLSLGLTGAFGSAPSRDTGTIRTVAFTLVKHANGTVTLTINQDVLLEPSTLQSDLRQDGIPALVTTGSFCSSNPSPAGFNQAVVAGQQKTAPTFTINPAAIPAGTELSFGYFKLANAAGTGNPGQESAAALIDTNSYTCASTAPTATPAGGFMEVWIPGGSKAAAKSSRKVAGRATFRARR
jgi:hypothetical protein